MARFTDKLRRRRSLEEAFGTASTYEFGRFYSDTEACRADRRALSSSWISTRWPTLRFLVWLQPPPCDGFSSPRTSRTPRRLFQDLVQGGDCVANVRVTVTGTGGGRGALWSPRFPRAKEVGWWVVLGTENGELLALKRVSGRLDF